MPSRALLTESQTIPAADITQALANIGIARASLSASVTRTSTTALSNTGLSALTVNLLPSSRYRLTYRLFAAGDNGFKIGFTFPSALPTYDAQAIYTDVTTNTALYILKDWSTTGFGSGVTIQDSSATALQNGGMFFTADILTGSTANTYGDFAVVFAQSSSGATASTMSQSSCVEVLKFS